MLKAQLLSWSTLLSLPGYLVFWSTGRYRWDWLVGVGWEVMWITYGIWSDQYAFAVSGVIFGVIFARNWWVWPTRKAAVKSGARTDSIGL